jgi:hypothetical protein
MCFASDRSTRNKTWFGKQWGRILKIEGRCHCGAIAYEAEVEPDTITVCHCRDCQRMSGSAFRAGVRAPAESFRILRGEPREYIKTAESGVQRRHAFCGNCGSPVYSCAIENPQVFTLRVGALDQPEELGKPDREIWTKRRLPWVLPLEGVPGTADQP